MQRVYRAKLRIGTVSLAIGATNPILRNAFLRDRMPFYAAA